MRELLWPNSKLKRELSSQKKYKAIAWEQLSSFEVMRRTSSAQVGKLNAAVLEKGNLIGCLRKTYELKKGGAVAFMTGSSGDLANKDLDTLYATKEHEFIQMICNTGLPN